MNRRSVDRGVPRANERRFAFALSLALAGAACGDDSTTMAAADAGTAAPSDAGVAAVRARFELGPVPMRFGDVPWPDDAYADAEGRVRVRGLPSKASPEVVDALTAGMAELDGFGIRPTIYFRFDGDLDPKSLPASPADSVDSDASVFVLDADTASPNAFARIPVEVAYESELREIRLRPAHQRALTPGRVYAAVVTRAVRDSDGGSIEGGERFVAIRDAVSVPSDPLERAARARYAPLLESLGRRGLPRRQVAALAVFRVQTVDADLADARAALRSTGYADPAATEGFGVDQLEELLGMPPALAVGLDDGAAHDHIGFLVHGRYTSPNLLSTKAGVHGAFERSASGEVRIKRQDEVPFTLALPRGVDMGAPLPVVIVQHDWLGERSDALAVANALVASGYAVIAADAPFHGLRSGMGDRVRRFTMAEAPDGFGDAPGDFAGENEMQGDLMPFHPFYYRDAVRQGVVDLLQLVAMLRDGNWSAVNELDPALSGFKFDATRIRFVGLGLGADMGVMLAALEPELSPIVLAFPSGSTVDGWVDSPARRALYDRLLTELGLETDAADDPGALPPPDLDVWRALTDGANPLAHAPALRSHTADILMLMARDDEVAHNAGTEALAYVLSATQVGGLPHYEQALATGELPPGAKVSANVDVAGQRVTRILYTLDPASHAALQFARDTFAYKHPPIAPFVALDVPVSVSNPLEATLRQVAFFFESYRACQSESVCAALVTAPVTP